LPVNTFYDWRRRLEADSAVIAAPAFLPVRVVERERCALPVALPSAGCDGVPLEIVVAGGQRVVVRAGFDAQTLQEVILALEALPCSA
jgi:hypothetical protein